MYYTENVVEAIINKEHGWAVAEQFESTWSDRSEENFSEQNSNALNYILHTIRGILRSDVFSQDAVEEIESYKEDLEDYLGL
jgi:hypothetical protein